MKVRGQGFRSARRLSGAGLALRLGLVASAVPVGWARAMRSAPKRREPVIAVVVALVLLAAPSLAVASASGREHAGRASSSRGVAVEHGFFVSPNGIPVCSPPCLGLDRQQYNNAVLLRSLKLGAGSLIQGIAQGAVIGLAGWVLDQWGLGSGSGIEDQIAEIRTQLSEIQKTLTKLQAATEQLRTEVAESHFSNLVSQASGIVASVDADVKELDAIAHMSKDDPRKKERTDLLLRAIDRDLLRGKQKELADRMSGTIGADGLIAAAYKAELAHHRLWSRLTSLQVRAVAAYYQGVETDLLLLRVEYMHAHRYTNTEIEAAISEVDGYLQKQDGELKPEPGANVIADTRTHLEWLSTGLGLNVTFQRAQTFAADVGSTGLFPVPTYSCCVFGIPYVSGFVYRDVGKGWRLPLWIPELANFYAGWSDPSGSWVAWLDRQTGEQNIARNGVWATISRPEGRIEPIGIGNDAAPRLSDAATERSLFLVRTRTSRYW